MRTTYLRRLSVVAVTASAIVLGACGGTDDSESGDDDAGTPVAGGSVVYGLENETIGGYCLPESQLAISGIQVAKTIYDTLTAPDESGEVKPFLAESIESNDDFTEWTITLREGVTFHDDSPLTAEVVKNNLDAYRGQYEARSPLLFQFVFENIDSVEVVDELTLTVTTKEPWSSFPAQLHGSGRVGIVAQAQLDDPDNCDKNMIGTGPFMLDEWVINDRLTASKNPNYWYDDADGNPLPYLDSIEYRPIVDETARLNSLEGGEIQAMHTNDGSSIEPLEAAAESGSQGIVQSDQYSEVSYVMFNVSKAPFDNPLARQAVTAALDREQYNTIIGFDQFDLGSGPFAPGVTGYLEDAGFPDFDLDEAKDLVAQYEAETGEQLQFTMTSVNSPSTVRGVSLIQEQMKAAGIDITLDPIEQSQQINTALGDDWQAQLWRNHPGGDPDLQYNWWKGGSPVNFNKFDDAEINDRLDAGRSTDDPDERDGIYEEINSEFSKELYNVWLNWSNWTVGTATDVEGVLGPQLPDGEEPVDSLVTGHPVSGMWISQ